MSKVHCFRFKILNFKPLNIFFCFLFSVFCFLSGSAQSYNVYQCDFEHWKDEMPIGWEFPLNGTFVVQVTPAYSGSYSCMVVRKRVLIMKSTVTFPIYWGKKYVLSFAAKLRGASNINVSIVSKSLGNLYLNCLNKTITIGSDWELHEIEFIPVNEPINFTWSGDAPVGSIDNSIVIEIENASVYSNTFVIDHISITAKDQTMEFNYLEANSIKAYIDPIVPFANHGGINYFHAPKNSGKSPLFISNIWLGGLDEQDNLIIAAHKHCQFGGRDFWIGPITNDFDGEDEKEQKIVSEAYIQKYYHTWSITKEEIEYHKLHYADADYTMPWAIANFPAHGRTQHGESWRLAPYKNVSGASWYAPHLGDYPEIRGDQTVFFITNDAMGKHKETNSQREFGVEVLGMAYAFNSAGSALQNTIFLSYIIRNKSLNNYKDFYFGFFNDFEIGYSMDDYVGCDTSLNLSYGYNAVEFDGVDETITPEAYGLHPPAQGAMFLNQKMSTFVAINNAYLVPTAAPRTDEEYYNFLRAVWADGTPVTYGGTGYDPESSNYTKFTYSGNPATGTGWTELTPNGPGSMPNEAGDRFGIMSAGPFELPAGRTLCIDIAMPFARDYSGNHLSSVALLLQRAQAIQVFYNSQNYEHDCANAIDIKDIPIINNKLLLYPNPTNGVLQVTSNELPINSIEIFDLLGKKLVSNPISQSSNHVIINISHLSKGLYIYKIILQNHTLHTGKVMIY